MHGASFSSPVPARRLRVPAWLLTCLLVLSLGASAAFAQSEAPPETVDRLALTTAPGDGPVFHVPLDGVIDKELARYIDRALAEAEDQEAAAVVFHVDTFGGLVDAADHIRKALLNAPMPTVAFIDKNAASAGALISYATDRIVMVPGASIGAATVVEGMGGEAAPDKYQSYMRGLMRATAEAKGRDPRIAEAMVDETLAVEGVSEAGKVLTLSAEEALRLGVAEAVLPSFEATVEGLGLGAAVIVAHRATALERFLRFLASPVVQSILMLMMMGGLYFELQTPGVGFAGAMALLGAAMFFAPHYMMGLVESWELVLFGIGVLLLLAELFVIPGFGVAGAAGLVLIVGSLFTALIGNVGLTFPDGGAIASAVGTMAVTMVLLVVLLFSLSRYLPRSERFHHLVLAPTLSSATGYTSADTEVTLVGRTGRALTPLRPAGAAEVDGRRVDVITAGAYVASGTAVKVVSVRGSRVEVAPLAALPKTEPAASA